MTKIDSDAVLAMLNKLMEMAEDCTNEDTQPTAQEALDWAISEVESLVTHQQGIDSQVANP